MSAWVLVVDDEPGIQLVVRSILELEGFKVVVAGDGIQALEALDSNVPKLIILDLVMPRMDGFAFAEALEAKQLRSKVRILLLTAHAEGSERAARLGADDYLGKPFDMDDLLGKVHSLLAPD